MTPKHSESDNLIEVRNYPRKTTNNKLINFSPHKNTLAVIQLSGDGRFVATASIKGTIIRIHDTSREKDNLIQEFRRGLEGEVTQPRSPIHFMCFNHNGEYLAASSSDKKTVHVFKV